MNTLLWAGLVANAIVHLRIAVLEVQDGEDQVKAGKVSVHETICWQKGGRGIPTVLVWVLLAPAITAFTVGKFLLFPRGIKSKFAKEQAALAKLAAQAEAEQKQAEEAARRYEEGVDLIRTWAPGAVLLAAPEPQPEQVALGWNHAADAFDVACEMVAATKGQPWSPTPPKKRIRATAGTTAA
jgi:hypothetical protein